MTNTPRPERRKPMVHTYRGLIELSDELKEQVTAGTLARLVAVERMMSSTIASMTYGPTSLQKSMMRDMGMVALDFRKWLLTLPPVPPTPGRAQVVPSRDRVLAIATKDHIAREWRTRQSDDFTEKYVMWVATNRDAVLQFLRGTIDLPVYIVGEVPWLDERLWSDIRSMTQFIHTEEY